MTIHRVHRGDTLSEISRRYGVSIQKIAKANGIADPNRINAGAKLVIPDKPKASSGPGKPNGTAQASSSAATMFDGQGLPAYSPATVKSKQDFHVPRNKRVLPETYSGAETAKLWKSLDDSGVAYPPIEDEAHVNGKLRTTYAAVDRKAGTLIVGLDNAAYHSRGYEGLSKGERRFAADMAQYAKDHGLTAVFLAHVPPNTKPKKGTLLPSLKEGAEQRAWMRRLREQYPDAIWVHGHKHPRRTQLLDLNGAAGGKEVSHLVLAGQARDSVTKITTYAHGRRIEEFKLVGHGEDAKLKRIQSVTLNRDGKRVDPANHHLGAAKGVLYGVADVHHGDDLKAYYRALAADARAEQHKGRSVSYLDVGDHTVKNGRIPVDLPGRERYYFVPGNHDYYNHGSPAEVVSSFRPAGEPFRSRIDWTK